MSSQKKVIQFIKDHYDGDMEQALNVLAEAAEVKAPKKTSSGRGNMEAELENFWYSLVIYLNTSHTRFLEGVRPVQIVTVKPRGIKKILKFIRPYVDKINKECGLNTKPGHDKYNQRRELFNGDLHKQTTYFDINDKSAPFYWAEYSNDDIKINLYVEGIECENKKNTYENIITMNYP